MRRRRVVRRRSVSGRSWRLACRARAGRRPAPRPRRRPRSGNGLNVLLITIDTLRADHLGAYGYARPTSPHIDALAQRGTVFEQRVHVLAQDARQLRDDDDGAARRRRTATARRTRCSSTSTPPWPACSRQAGYRTAAIVDNPNVAAQHGYAQGLRTLPRDVGGEGPRDGDGPHARHHRRRRRASCAAARRGPAVLPLAALRQPARALHAARALRHRVPRRRRVAGRAGLPVVPGFHGGIPKQWAVPGQDRLGYYVAQYDGEIAAVDAGGGAGAGRARRRRPARGRTVGRAHLRPRREPGRARLLLRPRRGPLRSLPAHPADRVAMPGCPGRAPLGRAGQHARPRADRSSTR